MMDIFDQIKAKKIRRDHLVKELDSGKLTGKEATDAAKLVVELEGQMATMLGALAWGLGGQS